MKIAYLTPDPCGSGHAVRGVALLRAAQRAGIELRAIGPAPVSNPGNMRSMNDLDCGPLIAAGFEATDDWYGEIVRYRPDLLIGDLTWLRMMPVLERLPKLEAWLIVRRLPACNWLRNAPGIERWTRVISIEPLTETLVGTTHAVQPIVVCNPDEAIDPSPFDGLDVSYQNAMLAQPFPVAPLLTKVRSLIASAGYNTYWESVWMGYRDRVTWLDEVALQERWERVQIGGEMTANGADELIAMITS
ncbi:MAG: hypothetical protein ACOYB2_10655 [Limnohabitans sp.]